MTSRLNRLCLLTGLTVALLAPGTHAAPAASLAASGEYRADIPFPEFMPMWREGWSWEDENGDRVQYASPGMPLGGYLFAYFQNTSSKTLVRGDDVLLNGVSLAEGVAPEHKPKNHPDDKYPSSLKFSKLAADQLATLVTAGEPVWWKVEPRAIAPGGYGQITIRLRREPQAKELTLTVPAMGDTAPKIVVPVGVHQPRFFSVNFTPDFKTAYTYLRHPSGKGIAPARILVDGKETKVRILADEQIDTVPAIIEPEGGFKQGQWYMLEAIYPDGLAARVSIGAWQPGLVYGMWGFSKVGQTEDDNRKFFLEDMRVHNINTLMYSISGEVRAFLRSPEGLEYTKRTGIRVMTNWVNDAVNPPFLFLTDEPDAADFQSKMLDPYKRIGSLAQALLGRADMFRQEDATVPVLLNVDNTFKPENWYTYGQLVDLPCADPYYQEAVQSLLKCDPSNWAAYLKPTYVYGVGTIYQSAAAPKPMHLILHTCRFDMKDTPYRGPTPEEKRVEVYYSLAAGAKALSFWWYTPFGEYYGCGGSDKDMRALWKEIGLVGAEIRSAEDLILQSSPANVPIKHPRMLWVRSLLMGPDTLGLIIVNDDFSSDRLGTVVRPVTKAKLSVQSPSWLKAADVFEINYNGTQDVQWKAEQSALSLELGTVNMTRFVVISKDKSVRGQIQQKYDARYAENVKTLLAQQVGQ